MTSGPGDRGTRFAAIPDRKKSLTDRSVSVRLGFVGELNDQQQTFARRFHVSLKASTRQVTGVTIVDLSGNIKLGEGTSVLRETVKDLLGRDRRKCC